MIFTSRADVVTVRRHINQTNELFTTPDLHRPSRSETKCFISPHLVLTFDLQLVVFFLWGKQQETLDAIHLPHCGGSAPRGVSATRDSELITSTLLIKHQGGQGYWTKTPINRSQNFTQRFQLEVVDLKSTRDGTERTKDLQFTLCWTRRGVWTSSVTLCQLLMGCRPVLL